MAKVDIFCDGFNLFYGLRTHHKLSGRCYYWLNLYGFYTALASRKPYGSPEDTLRAAKHFTADPIRASRRARHQAYYQVIQDIGGVSIINGRHTNKLRTCRAKCKKQYWDYEEKETDVSVGIHILRAAYENSAEKILVISADSDFVPALKMVRKVRPEIQITVLSPLGANKGYRLGRLADFHVKLKEKDYSPHLLANPYTMSNGTSINRPAKWR